MNKFKLLAIGLCLAALFLPSVARIDAGNAEKQIQGPLSPDTVRLAPNAPAAASKHKMKNTLVNAGFGAAATSGFVALDAPSSLDCTTTTCSYEVVQNVQVLSGTAGNRFAICTQIDGTYMGTPNCAYLGVIANDGFYHAGTFLAIQGGIPFGPHTVQTFLYTDNGSTVGNWGVTYHVYK